MIRLKVFISSVQKEMRSERIAIGAFLSTDDFLRECKVPRIFEEYPQPLFPNPKAYLDLLRQCQIYLLLVGSQYGIDAGDGLSATHEEYRLAQELKLPTLIVQSRVDYFVPLAVAEYLQRQIAGSELAVIDAEGHLPHISAPDALISVMQRFMAAHGCPPATPPGAGAPGEAA